MKRLDIICSMTTPLPLDDPRWTSFQGGYRIPYDASPMLALLMGKGLTQTQWSTFSGDLHHQGDVGDASYASVPWFVERLKRSEKLDECALGWVVLIEVVRPANPPMSPIIAPSYAAALEQLPRVLVDHPDQAWSEMSARWAAAALALCRGQRWLGSALSEVDVVDLRKWLLDDYGWEGPRDPRSRDASGAGSNFAS